MAETNVSGCQKPKWQNVDSESGRTPHLCRPYWRCYFPNTQAVIYVVDSTDVDRMGTSKDEFHAILEVGAKGILWMVLAISGLGRYRLSLIVERLSHTLL